MAISNQKKISEILELSDEFILSFEVIIPKALSIVKSEIFSNPNFHELIGNNPQKMLEDLIQSHLKILLTAMQFDNINILTKGLSHLYRYCLNRGFSEELLKIEFFSLDNALNLLVKNNKEEIKRINEEIYEKFDKIISPPDLSEKKYAKIDKDEEFIRNFTSKLIDLDFIQSEILIKSYIIEDETRDRIYNEILYQSVEVIKDMFENFIIDQPQTNVILSIFNRVISSIYISNAKKSHKDIYIVYFPIDEILGMNLYAEFYRIQSLIIADMLDFKGATSYCTNYQEIYNIDFKKNPDFFIFWCITPYNFSLFLELKKFLRYKFPNLKCLIHTEDLDQTIMKSYGQIVHNLKEILEVTSNDKEIF